MDWAGFTSSQRLVILVALIAAVALVYAAGLLARSLGTQAMNAGVVPMPITIKATLANGTDNRPPYDGHVVALRPDGQLLFRHDNGGQHFDWVLAKKLVLR